MAAAIEDDAGADLVLAAERDHLASSREFLRLMREDVLSLPALAGDHVSQEYLKADLYRRAQSLRDLPDTPLFFGRLDYTPGLLGPGTRAEQGEGAPLLSDQIEPCQGMRFSIMFVESFGQYGRSVRHGRFLLFQAATDSICYCLVIHRHN